MDLAIDDHVVIVTGGSKGIGEGICRALAAERAIPVIVGRSPDEGHQLVEEFKSAGVDAGYFFAELSNLNDCQMAVKKVATTYGRIDGLVNNAGLNDGVGLEKGSPEAFLESLNNNLHHYYYMAQLCLPWLKKFHGNIVNVSSKTALTGQGGTSGYAASKGAQLALTREWAVELLKYQIRVNAVVPAEVMTPLYKKWLTKFENPQLKLEDITKNIPLGGRMTTKEEMASMVVYLLSRQASHITGQFLFVDGGYVHLDRALAGSDL
jgi:NAD(P)-dependent dehydrogenase (short-subunit alcohol dehydrogenase family)